jgi:hypothetical protein
VRVADAVVSPARLDDSVPPLSKVATTAIAAGGTISRPLDTTVPVVAPGTI